LSAPAPAARGIRRIGLPPPAAFLPALLDPHLSRRLRAALADQRGEGPITNVFTIGILVAVAVSIGAALYLSRDRLVAFINGLGA
jgi:hypothetical protein